MRIIKHFDTADGRFIATQISDNDVVALSFDGKQNNTTIWLTVGDIKDLAKIIKEALKERKDEQKPS